MATDATASTSVSARRTQRAIGRAHPDALLRLRAEFPAGSMLPKVIAACDFARATGKQAVIGGLTTSTRCSPASAAPSSPPTSKASNTARPRAWPQGGMQWHWVSLRGRQAAQGHGPPARARAHAPHAVERGGAAVRRRALGEAGQGGARRVLRGRCASAASRSSRPRRCSPRRFAKPRPKTGSPTTS